MRITQFNIHQHTELTYKITQNVYILLFLVHLIFFVNKLLLTVKTCCDMHDIVHAIISVTLSLPDYLISYLKPDEQETLCNCS